MVDEPTPAAGTPATPDPTPAEPVVEPAKGTPVISADDIKGKTPDEIVKFVAERAETYGATKKTMEEYETWIKNTKPYIDAITEDPELTKQVEAAYKKKYNPDPPKEDKKESLINKESDNRQALENQLMSQFEQGHGLDKLEGDAKKAMNVKIGQELMELLDPSGTKNYNDVIAEVSLAKLPKYLDKAYSLATMDDTIKKAQETAQAEANAGATGIISSVPSSSPNSSDTTLTPQERQLAQKMGVPEDRWLENKKAINARNEGR